MSGSPLWCSRRGTACCPSPLRGSWHWGMRLQWFPLVKWKNQKRERLELGWRLALSYLGWASDGGCPSSSGCLSGSQKSGRDLCVRWGKGEKELGIISLAVVGHAMSRDDRTKGPSVHREEEGSEDWALRDSSNKGMRGSYINCNNHPLGIFMKICIAAAVLGKLGNSSLLETLQVILWINISSQDINALIHPIKNEH